MSEVSLDEADISTAVLVFAHYLGIDLETEQELLPIAENALRNLPAGWELGIGDGDNAGIPYFFNESSGASVWKHPKEVIYIRKVKEEKKRIQLERDDRKRNRKADTPSNSGRDQQKQSDRGRDDSNWKSSTNNGAKMKETNPKTFDNSDEVIEVSDFYQDDNDSDDVLKKSSTSNTGKNKKESNSKAYGMSAADFLSDEEEEEEKTVSQSRYVQKEADKSSSNSWNQSSNSKEKTTRSSRNSISESWDDEVDQDDNNSAVPSREGSLARQSDGFSRGNDDGSRGKDTRRLGEFNEKNAGRPRSPGKEARERQIKDAEFLDRERKERENREKDTRERDIYEKRDKEKSQSERDRERERDRNAEASSAMAKSVFAAEASLHASKKDHDDQTAQLRRKHTQEVDDLRARLSETEDRLKRNMSEGDSRVRDSEEAVSSKIRDTQRKAKIEAEDEARDNIKSLERRHAIEVEELKSEVTSNKRKYDECMELLEATKRKAGLSKENGILEGRVEMEAARASVRELESQLRLREAEFSKYRDDHGAMAGRLASALQTTQVSVAECEVAKAQAVGAMSDGQVSHGALLQATLRIQLLESESVQLKSELLLLRSQGEGQEGELRRLQNSVSSTEEKLTQTTADLKRAKATAQSDAHRQNSRIAELDALNCTLRTQMDMAMNNETDLGRDLQRLLDKSEYEASRLRDRLVDVQAKEQAEAVRCLSLEKESRTFEELMHLRDRSVREEKQKADDAEGRLESVRVRCEGEVAAARALLLEEKALGQDLVRKHRAELDGLKNDIAEKVPKIVSTAVERVESQLALRVEKEVSSAKLRYEHQMDRAKQELIELQSGQAEREARNRVTHAEEKAELDRLRYHSQRLQRRLEEQEEEIDELKASRRRKAVSSPEREKGGIRERERDRDRDRQWGRGWDTGRGRGSSRGDSQLPDARLQSRPHVATTREFRKSSDMAGSNQGWFREGNRGMREEIDGDEGSYASETEDGSPSCNSSPVENKSIDASKSRSNADNKGSSSSSRRSRGNNLDRSTYPSRKSSRRGGQSDKEIVEETLAMQTMSLIHGQLTAMKHQLLTISDGSIIPDTEGDVTRSQGRSFQMDRKDFSQQNGSAGYSNNRSINSNKNGNSNNGIRDPGALHASEQAIQRMFHPQQNQDRQNSRTPTRQSVAGVDSRRHEGGQVHPGSQIFPPSEQESLLSTPFEQRMHMASSFFYSAPSSFPDNDSSITGGNRNVAVPVVSINREREDLMGGGTSSASLDDSQEGEGGFHEGYWRAKYHSPGRSTFGSPLSKGVPGTGSVSAIRMR